MSVFQDGKRYYSFLSITWAMIADVDIGGDSIRWMGPIRVSLNAVKCIIRGKRYEGHIRYYPSKETTPSQQKESAFKMKYDTSDEDQLPEFLDGPDCPLLKKYFAEDLKKILNLENISSQTEEKSNEIVEMNERFLVWLACNVSHIASDANFAPNAKLCDGSVDMLFIRKQVSRIDLLKMFSNIESGDHLKHPSIEYVKCSALSIEPKSNGSYVAIDGEPVAYKKTIAEVHKGLLKILAL